MERQGSIASLILAAALALGACNGVRSRNGAAGDLEVTTELDLSTTRPREGVLATVVFRIKNASENYIVLRDLTYLADPALKESASAAATWQFEQEGKLTDMREGNEYKYDRRATDPSGRKLTTPPLFNSGLLVPTESITVRTRLRLLSFPKFFQILYFELPFEKVRSDVYFETRQERQIRYRMLIGDELRDRLLPDPKVDAKGHRIVLYPFAERVEPSAKIKPIKVESDLQHRAFSLADAVRKSGGAPAEQFTYSASLDAWVLKRGLEFSLVTSQAETPLPLLRQMDRTFYFIDSMGMSKIEIELQNDAVASVMQLEKKYAVVRQKQGGQTRYFLFLAPGDLLKFLADARSAKMAIDVDMTSDGGRLRLLQ